MLIKDSIFREYDIRGVVGSDFDGDFAFELGRAYAWYLRDHAKEERAKDLATLKIAVGWDCRLSSPELSEQLIRGLQQGGLNVVRGGMGPTPQLYYTVFSQNLDGGIQVTGSHNPADQNGFKLLIGKVTISGVVVKALNKAIREKSADSYQGPAGKLEEFDAQYNYTEELVKRIKPQMGKSRKLKVVVDAGNGVGGLVGPEALRRLGCEVVELYTEPNGRFPNHHPDPTVTENIAELQQRVVAERADVGFAWDGDADRLGVVDEKGEIIWGDKLLIIYGRHLLKEVKRPIIIGDVKCSQVLFDDLSARGAEMVMWRTGHSLIKAKLKELQGHLAGEMSGHMYFVHRYYGFDDGIYASLLVAEILSQSSQPISALIADLPARVATPEIRVDCPDKLKFAVAEQAKESFGEYETITIDGVRVKFPHGWGLVRASNTQPALILRFEADTEENLKSYRAIFESRLNAIQKSMAATSPNLE